MQVFTSVTPLEGGSDDLKTLKGQSGAKKVGEEYNGWIAPNNGSIPTKDDCGMVLLPGCLDDEESDSKKTKEEVIKSGDLGAQLMSGCFDPDYNEDAKTPQKTKEQVTKSGDLGAQLMSGCFDPDYNEDAKTPQKKTKEEVTKSGDLGAELMSGCFDPDYNEDAKAPKKTKEAVTKSGDLGAELMSGCFDPDYNEEASSKKKTKEEVTKSGDLGAALMSGCFDDDYLEDGGSKKKTKEEVTKSGDLGAALMSGCFDDDYMEESGSTKKTKDEVTKSGDLGAALMSGCFDDDYMEESAPAAKPAKAAGDLGIGLMSGCFDDDYNEGDDPPAAKTEEVPADSGPPKPEGADADLLFRIEQLENDLAAKNKKLKEEQDKVRQLNSTLNSLRDGVDAQKLLESVQDELAECRGEHFQLWRENRRLWKVIKENNVECEAPKADTPVEVEVTFKEKWYKRSEEMPDMTTDDVKATQDELQSAPKPAIKERTDGRAKQGARIVDPNWVAPTDRSADPYGQLPGDPEDCLNVDVQACQHGKKVEEKVRKKGEKTEDVGMGLMMGDEDYADDATTDLADKIRREKAEKDEGGKKDAPVMLGDTTDENSGMPMRTITPASLAAAGKKGMKITKKKKKPGDDKGAKDGEAKDSTPSGPSKPAVSTEPILMLPNLTTDAEWAQKIAEGLMEKDGMVRKAAVNVFAAMGETAAGAVATAAQNLYSQGVDVRKSVMIHVSTMSEATAQEAAPKLALTVDPETWNANDVKAAVKILEHTSPVVRLAAIVSLMTVTAGPSATSVAGEVVKCIEDPMRFVREATVLALAALGKAGRPCTAAISKRLRHKSAAVRKVAVDALGALGQQAAPYARDVARRLEDDSWMVPLAAVKAIAAMGEAAKPYVPEIAKRLDSDDYVARKTAVIALGTMGQLGAQHAGKAAALLKDTTAVVRKAAIEALVSWGGAGSLFIREVIVCLDDEDSDVRAAAVTAVGALGNDKHAAEIAKRLKDDQPQVRTSAVEALKEMGLTEAVRQAAEDALQEKKDKPE